MKTDFKFRYLYTLLGSVLILAFCSCKEEQDIYREVDYKSMAFVMADNYNISSFTKIINMTGLREAINSDEKFTVLAPENQAFLYYELNDSTILLRGTEWINNVVNSHFLGGHLDLHSLPFNQPQKLYTRNGNVLYASKWLEDVDTVFTFNGVTAYPEMLPTSNGEVYILRELLQTEHYNNVVQALQDYPSLSLFSFALIHSGLSEEVAQKSGCTVFAPDNLAMQTFGYTDLQSILNSNPDELKRLVRHHIYDNFMFVGDLPYTLAVTGEDVAEIDVFYPSGTIFRTYMLVSQAKSQILMSDNKIMPITYSFADVGSGRGYRLVLSDHYGFTANVDPLMKDVVSGNGVIHSISSVLNY